MFVFVSVKFSFFFKKKNENKQQNEEKKRENSVKFNIRFFLNSKVVEKKILFA